MISQTAKAQSPSTKKAGASTGSRNLLIDMWRIIATLLVMKHHTYYMQLANEQIHFRQAFIYVEFFFLLSGYYTYLHFKKCSYTYINDMARDSIRYTIKKALRFLPYTIPAVIAQYMLNIICMPGQHLSQYFHTLEEMPRDLLLLTATSGWAAVGPLWYLSGMLLATPILGMCFQLIPQYLMLIISVISGLLYYGMTNAVGLREVPHDFLRALFCMMLGVLVYCVAEELSRINVKKSLALILGELLLLYTVASTYIKTYSTGNGRHTVIMAFAFGISFLLAGGSRSLTFPSSLQKAIGYLCSVSFAMYVWQKTVATAIALAAPNMSDGKKVLCFYIGTFVVSAIHKAIVDKITTKR